jgi:hypothetical protein
MKKKSLAHLGWILATALLLTGCGSNKHLNPISELVLVGASPAQANIAVKPANDTLTYFVFRVRLTDNSLSMVPSDAWTIDSYDVTYSLVNDPGHHLTALPADFSKKANHHVNPGPATRYSIQMVSAAYLNDNAQGFVGTADVATVKASVVFRTHRNKDGYAQTFTGKYIMNIGNF